MLIKVKTLTGKEVSTHNLLLYISICATIFYFQLILFLFWVLQIEIDIEPTDRVERIKERVEEKEGIPPQQQRLIFSGKQM